MVSNFVNNILSLLLLSTSKNIKKIIIFNLILLINTKKKGEQILKVFFNPKNVIKHSIRFHVKYMHFCNNL